MKMHRRRDVHVYDDGKTISYRHLLLGAKGAVQFIYYIMPECYFLSPTLRNLKDGSVILPVDRGYHSPKPFWEDSTSMPECDVLEGACYYDGSGLAAYPIADAWIDANEDEEIIYQLLGEYYQYTFYPNEEKQEIIKEINKDIKFMKEIEND